MKLTVDIRQIWISPGHDFKGRAGQTRLKNGVVSVSEIECRAGSGLVGDRYYNYKPDFKGQVTFIDEAVLEALADHFNLPTIEGWLMRRNILLVGVDLNTLIGKHFKLNDVELTGSEECAPCFWMDEAVTPGAHEWLKGRGGLRCRIVTDGTLKCGPQTLEILPPVMTG